MKFWVVVNLITGRILEKIISAVQPERDWFCTQVDDEKEYNEIKVGDYY